MAELELIYQEAERDRQQVPVLFIHGAWHGAWCWLLRFFPVFLGRGFDCYAVSLRHHGASNGRGKSLRWCSLDDYVEDIKWAVEQVKGNTWPVLVGHSLGWRVAHRYAERYPVSGLVNLAGVPTGGILAMILRFARRFPLALLRLLFTCSLRPAVNTLEKVRHFLFSVHTPDWVVEEAYQRLGNESFWVFLQCFRPCRRRPTNKPILVVGGEGDRLITTTEIQRSAQDLGAAEVFFDGGHDLMLEPEVAEEVAASICSWIEGVVLTRS